MTLSPRAALNLQRRLYDLWTNRLIDAVELSEQAGPSERLEEVLALVQQAEAGVKAAIAAAGTPHPPHGLTASASAHSAGPR